MFIFEVYIGVGNLKALCFIFFVIIMVFDCTVQGQDIEQLGQKVYEDPLTINGTIAYQTAHANAYGSATRRPPYYWSLHGSLELRFFNQVSAPVSFTYSPQGNNFNYPFQRLQPFNQIGISPNYKSITIHLGYRTINLSRYSLSGNAFNGVGCEWKPKKRNVEAALLYGRFAKANADTLQLSLEGINSFDRWGYGCKFTYKPSRGKWSVVMFKASDKLDSYPFPVALISGTNTPKENLITGLVIQQRVLKRFLFNLEYMRSAYTFNTLDANYTLQEGLGIYNSFDWIFTPKTSSVYSGALDASLSWNPQFMTIQLAYKRLEGNYYSLGMPFLNNDLELSSINLSKRFLNKQLIISGNIGIQRNNLQGDQLAQTSRLAYGGSANYTINDQWSTAINYSNFTTNTLKVRIEQIDSLTYYQVTEQLNGQLNYRIADNKNINQQIGLNVAIQQANDLNENNSSLKNTSISYSGNVKSIGLNISARWTGLQSLSPIEERIGTGPTLNIRKSWFNQVFSTHLALNGMQYYVSGKLFNRLMNTRIGLNYNLWKAHSFNLNFNWMHRNDFVQGKAHGEYQLSLAYRYHFSKGKFFKRIKKHATNE